jgi:MSHA biogenesis protein MshG
MLIRLSGWVDHYGWTLPLAIAAVIALYFLARRRLAFAMAADRLKFRLPLLGVILHKIQLSRFAHLLASLLDAGIPLVQALRLAAETVGNVHLRHDIDQVRHEVERGSSLAAAMSERGSFPPVCREMVAVGEESGRFVESLQRVSGYYDGQIDYAIKNLTVVIEPILLAVLGVVVLFVALAVFLPMWNLISVVRG